MSAAFHFLVNFQHFPILAAKGFGSKKFPGNCLPRQLVIIKKVGAIDAQNDKYTHCITFANSVFLAWGFHCVKTTCKNIFYIWLL